MLNYPHEYVHCMIFIELGENFQLLKIWTLLYINQCQMRMNSGLLKVCFKICEFFLFACASDIH